jgi:transglutaminase-like putative cysteine protease
LYLVPQKFDIAECEAIFDFVRDQIRYTKDVNGVETLSTPAITLATRQGDCDDKSTLLCALFEAVGYPTRFVIASYVTGQFEHVYVQVAVDGDWINADATENYPFGWCPPDAIRIDFERT